MTTEQEILCVECGKHLPTCEFTSYFAGEGVCETCLTRDLIAGGLDEGICVMGGCAHDIYRGTATKRQVGDTWELGGYLYEVVQNGDGTTWKPVAEAK